MSESGTFEFSDRPEDVVSAGDFVARVPAGLRSVPDLFTALAAALSFPDYFGHNWNALDECLRDLTWIDAKHVVLIHMDVPALEPQALTSYLESLELGVLGARPGKEPTLVVVFPESARDAVC